MHEEGSFDGKRVEQYCRDQLLGDYFEGQGQDAVARELLAYLDDCGSPLGICFLKPADVSEAEVHRIAAIDGMRVFAARVDCYYEKLARSRRTTRAEYHAISIFPDLLEGERITTIEFLGDGYDMNARRGILDHAELMNVDQPGLVYATCTAPHGVRDAGSVLDRVLAFFDWLEPAPVIFRWNDDWSNYFDAGREWWGTFFWTIHLPHRGLIACVAASTTD